MRAGALVDTATAGLEALRRMRYRTPAPNYRLAAFLGLYTPTACAAIGVLMLGFLPGAAVVDGAPNSIRLFTHLYPMVFAALALALSMQMRTVRRAGLGVLLAVGVLGQVQTVDLHNLAGLSRYDGTTLYWQEVDPTHPVASGLPLASTSPAFRSGVALIQQYQRNPMWAAITPAELAAMSHQRCRRAVHRQPPATSRTGPRRLHSWRRVCVSNSLPARPATPLR
ncbi:MAG: hypothetical protein CL927_03655 [Deltaproteobacteria bacterium]|nr:hypothetical protein [Deltaproteobacteria bacterium]HCH67022.1 hypothetical protein [Deltaproteobacteria bacterium]